MTKDKNQNLIDCIDAFLMGLASTCEESDSDITRFHITQFPGEYKWIAYQLPMKDNDSCYSLYWAGKDGRLYAESLAEGKWNTLAWEP